MPNDNLPVNQPGLTPSDDSDKTLSLMGGVAQAEGMGDEDLELYSMKPGSKFLSPGTLLILLAFLIAGGVIFAMRVSQDDMTSTGNTKEIEKRINEALDRIKDKETMDPGDPLKTENLNKLFNNVDEVVETFNSNVTDHQVPITLVKKNPFLLPTYKSLNPDPEPVNRQPEVDPMIEVYKQLDLEFNKLSLQSVMQGARPVAIINGEFVQPGQVVGSFKVKTISRFSVVLQAHDKTYTLAMEE